MEFPVTLPIVLFIFSQVETASHRSPAITHSHAFISTYHARERSLREVYSIEHSGLRIKKWDEKRENTALIQIIERKPFHPAFLFCFQE